MSQFLKRGDKTEVHGDTAISISSTLAASTYAVVYADREGLHLVDAPPMEVPTNLYGMDIDERLTRIITTFNDRKKSTGVLLAGTKGSGKTLLAKCLSQRLLGQGVPTVVISDSFDQHDLPGFIDSLSTSCLILLDEFEKVFDQTAQERLLTILDGTGRSKHLYVLTSNSGNVDDRLINRPGRVYYVYHYGSVSEQVRKNFIESNLKNLEYAEDLNNTAALFAHLNFDTLQTMVEEVNRFNKPISKLIKHLNASPLRDDATYRMIVYRGTQRLDFDMYTPNVVFRHPLAIAGRYDGDVSVNIALGRSIRSETERLQRDNCVSIEPGGKLVFNLPSISKDVRKLELDELDEGSDAYQKLSESPLTLYTAEFTPQKIGSISGFDFADDSDGDD